MKKMMICLLVLLCMIPAAMAEEPTSPLAPELVLEGNQTTGCDWCWSVDCEGVVDVACEYVVDWQPAFEGDIMPPGAGGHSRFVFKGLTPGEANITFAYKRPWEEKAPLYTLVYRVRVDENLNVTILSSSFDWNPGV